MMRLRWLALSALGVFLLGGSLAMAQSSGQSSDAGSDGFRLLREERVQSDLHLTNEQKVQILALNMEFRDNRGNISKKLSAVLTQGQMERLRQIRLQVEGPAAISRADVAAQLGLTKDQRQALRMLQDQIREETREIAVGLRGMTSDERKAQMPEVLKKLSAIRKDSTEKAQGILTPAQRKEFEAMQGKKLFDDAPSARTEQTADSGQASSQN